MIANLLMVNLGLLFSFLNCSAEGIELPTQRFGGPHARTAISKAIQFVISVPGNLAPTGCWRQTQRTQLVLPLAFISRIGRLGKIASRFPSLQKCIQVGLRPIQFTQQLGIWLVLLLFQVVQHKVGDHVGILFVRLSLAARNGVRIQRLCRPWASPRITMVAR